MATADQTDVDIPVKTWVAVATNVASAQIYAKKQNYKYFRIAVLTGAAAPTATVTDHGVPSGATPFKNHRDLVVRDSGVDIYVTCVPLNHSDDTSGQVSIDA